MKTAAESEYDRDAFAAAMRVIGARGGRARKAKLTKAQRREIARKAALARWAKRDPEPPSGSPTPTTKRRNLRVVTSAAAELGRAGGQAAQRGKTAAELSELGQRLARARWAAIPPPARARWDRENAANDDSAYAVCTDAVRILARTQSTGEGVRA